MRAGVVYGGAAAGMTSDQIAAAHARLIQDASIQFQNPPPPKVAPPPEWLINLLRMFGAASHTAGWVFWAVLAALLVGLIIWIVRKVLAARDGGRGKPLVLDQIGAPDAAKAKALLGDADALAAAGRYGEGVRLLLRRSIDDIEARRPKSVPASATAREIGGLPALSPSARGCFSEIARVVEAFAYAGRPVTSEAYSHCRAVYQDFALPTHWAAA